MHQTSNFVMRTNRQYDDRFAQTGAKNGQTLGVRLPPKYTTRTGNTMAVQNLVERQIPLTLATIKGVDLNLTQEQLTFSIDRLSENVLKPAITQLTATMEGDALSTLYKQVANASLPTQSLTTTTGIVDYRQFQNAGRYLSEQLAPPDPRTFTMDPQTRVDFSTDVKGLFQSSDNIKQQYVEGRMGRTGGFEVFENTLMPAHLSGTYTGALTVSATTSYVGTGNAWTTTFDLPVSVGTTMALKQGDILTISGVYDVHPETKVKYGTLKRFVVTSDTSSTGGNVPVSPAPITTGAYQNVDSAPQSTAVITVVGASSGASAFTYGQNLAFHRDAFAVVFADLEDPTPYGAWGSREVFDNMSLRIWRQGDIVNGTFPCRVDICYGVAAIYPEWACRVPHYPN
jgi:hypothetical protein